MSVRGDTSNSDSSVAPGKKNFTYDKIQVTKKVTQTYIISKSTDKISDHESSNVKCLRKRNIQTNITDYFLRYEMKNTGKSKAVRFMGSTSQQPQRQNVMLTEEVDLRRINRTPRWPENHNGVFGDLLMEQMMSGNILNGRVKRPCWGEIVSALNRILGSSYSESAVITRFKNMKSDFRTIFQLSNKSGWGWDEDLHLPVAPDEVWEEVLKDNPNYARFRRNPFHQYEIFERICGGNIAVGTNALSSQPTAPVSAPDETNLFDDYEVPNDEFMASNGVSFDTFVDVQDTSNNEGAEHLKKTGESGSSGMKRSGCETTKVRRRLKKRVEHDDIAKLVEKNSESARMLVETITKEDPYSMNVCYDKLSTLQNLTEEATVAVIDALSANLDNKIAFMKMQGRILRLWIEKVVSKDSRFHDSPVWT